MYLHHFNFALFITHSCHSFNLPLSFQRLGKPARAEKLTLVSLGIGYGLVWTVDTTTLLYSVGLGVGKKGRELWPPNPSRRPGKGLSSLLSFDVYGWINGDGRGCVRICVFFSSNFRFAWVLTAVSVIDAWGAMGKLKICSATPAPRC